VTGRSPSAALAALFQQPATSVDAALLDEAREHGLAPLAYAVLRDAGSWDAQPPEIREALARVAREAALAECDRRREFQRVLDTLATAGVGPLVFKGSAFAYTLYPEPWLRPRVDTDLLVQRQDLETTGHCLERLGYRLADRTSGELVTHQVTYERSAAGIERVFDVHWKIADPQAFADVFSYGELDADAVAVEALGGTRTLCDVHALLVACMHRVAHHYDREILLFIHDIALLARRLDAASWARLAAIAVEKRIGAVTVRGIDLASRYFGSPVPPGVRERLTASDGDEPTARYLDPHLRKVDILLSDFSQLDWRSRLALVREHLLPPAGFVRRSYAGTPPGLLPALYVYRSVRGAGAWFRHLR
jgi:hypothetical protein